MRRFPLLFGVMAMAAAMQAQDIDRALSLVKGRLDSISRFEVTLQMEVDIQHVNMPVKTAELLYEQGNSVLIRSDDFVMIPKKGLDFGLGELYRYPFMTLNLGTVSYRGRSCELIKVIPTTDASDYSIATLWLDRQRLRMLKSQISTKKNGTFDITYEYAAPSDVLPSAITVHFQVSDIRIPLRFLGREAQVDKGQLKEDPGQKGAIRLLFTNYRVTRLP
ncbi:MAG TPA: hypothetical protein VLL47_05840 [Robiginitalea sp.]|nr:hypothetical protein [Robiginitalea sp.]